MNRYVCIHAHFYQPPRENPWLEEVERQETAYPYHDWNERITAECYEPNTASRILDDERRIVDIVNNYEHISFNFGPTLLSWMERHSPETYRQILAADKQSLVTQKGHGNALAQVYNHIIMPLANGRDKRTQVLWGIEDFRRRFGRSPEGMWLAETAVDTETLEILAECGISFTILAPGQAAQVRKIGEKKWHDVAGAKVDPKRAYACPLPSGRSITLFFYDGPTAQQVAFAGLLDNGEFFARKLLSLFAPDDGTAQLVHIATDGETYGHHHRFGDMALAYCLYRLEKEEGLEIVNYGRFLELNPPAYEAQIIESSSWSCFHGVERWRAGCGCSSGVHPGWTQEWRAPLRGAMDWLRDNAARIFEGEGGKLLRDVWAARDAYVGVIADRTPQAVDAFLKAHALKELTKAEEVQALRLLEMQRHALLMFTSCGWFFDEISGIETLQILQYAARVLQLARQTADADLEEAFLGILERAPSNIRTLANGRGVYEQFIRSSILDMLRVGVHYAVSSIFTRYPQRTRLYVYEAERLAHDRQAMGNKKVVSGCVHLRSLVTREEEDVSFAVVHMGDHNVVGGARSFTCDAEFQKMQEVFRETFRRGEMTEVIRLIDRQFTSHSFSLWHLFKDDQRRVLDQIFAEAHVEIEAAFRRIYQHHFSLLQTMEKLNQPLPSYFKTVVSFVLNTDLERHLESGDADLAHFRELAEEAGRCGAKLDTAGLGLRLNRRVDGMMEHLVAAPQDMPLIEQILGFLRVAEDLGLPLDLWKAQNTYFGLCCRYPELKSKVPSLGVSFADWSRAFQELGGALKVKGMV
ncbi:MAG: DUF3536 domain-containing protein [Deltaproteobacteria bacterium]